MDGNPFIQLAGMIGAGKPADGLKLLRGSVVRMAPLTVRTAQLTVSGSALWINAELVTKRTGPFVGIAEGLPPMRVTGTCNIDGILKQGDSVLLLTTDYQVFYIICKVVSA